MHSLDGAVEWGVTKGSLVVVNVVDIELEAKVAGIKALVGLEAGDKGGMLERLDFLVDGVIGELRTRQSRLYYCAIDIRSG